MTWPPVDLHIPCEDREAGLAFLTKDGNLGVPCGRYGGDTVTCAPVAYRIAEIVCDSTGEPMTFADLDYAMYCVVNSLDDVEYLLTEYGEPGEIQEILT